jgi:hypothetical protein
MFIFTYIGSPFSVNVMDTQRVVAFGKGLGSIPINVPASFTILTQNAGNGDLKCSIKGGVSMHSCVSMFLFHTNSSW